MKRKKLQGKAFFFYKTNCFLRNSVSLKVHVKPIVVASSPKLRENLSVLENEWSIKKAFILIKVARSSNQPVTTLVACRLGNVCLMNHLVTR